MRTMDYTVEATYNYKAHGTSLDGKLDRLLRRQNDGAGCDFKERDVTWTFRTRKGAENAAAKLRAVRGVKARVY